MTTDEHSDLQPTREARIRLAIDYVVESGCAPETIQASQLAGALDPSGTSFGSSPDLFVHDRLVRLIGTDDSPESLALRTLLGLEQGFRGAPVSRRRQEASRYLRTRRPKDPDLDADAPLSPKRQAVVIETLVARLVSRINLKFPPAPLAADASDALEHFPSYEVIEVGTITWLDKTLRPTREINRYVIRALDPVYTYSRAAQLPGVELEDLEITAVGAVIERIIAQSDSSFTTILRFDEPLAPGATRTLDIDTKYLRVGETARHSISASLSPAAHALERLRLPAEVSAEVRRVELPDMYEDDLYDDLQEVIKPDKFRWVEAEFSNMQPMWNYGLAWKAL